MSASLARSNVEWSLEHRKSIGERVLANPSDQVIFVLAKAQIVLDGVKSKHEALVTDKMNRVGKHKEVLFRIGSLATFPWRF